MKSRTKPALRVVPAAQVQLSLAVDGVLRDVQPAFYGLCVNAGKQVLAAMMEADRVTLCGARNVPDVGRQAVRGGTTRSSVVLGGQRIAVAKPRARSLQRGELELPTFAWAAHTDPLDMATLASIAAGVSTRRYAGTLDELPEPEEPLSVSKSAVSRRWVALSQAQLHEWLSGSIKELDLPVVMIDGIHFRDRVILVALGIDAKGNKHVLGLREGSTQSTRVVRSLLSDLVARGLDADRARLWVIDGGKALRRAIVDCFGALALVQRCQEHYADLSVMPTWCSRPSVHVAQVQARSAYSQGLQEAEQGVRWAIPPRLAVGHLSARQCSLLDAKVGMEVYRGRVDALVAEPQRDHRGMNTCFQKPHGRGVSAISSTT
jgi:hypothetical protein